MPSERVLRKLKQIIAWRGKSEVIRCDNGQIALALQYRHGRKIDELDLNIFSLVIRNKTLMLNGSIGLFGMNGCRNRRGARLCNKVDVVLQP